MIAHWLLDCGLVALSFGLSWWLTLRLTRPESRLAVLDEPNERSMHATPVPRGGGLAIVGAATLVALLLAWRHGLPARWIWPAVGLAAVLVVSYLDDRHTLRNSPRFVVHCLAAVMAVYSGVMITELRLPGITLPVPHSLLAAFSAVYIVWMINMYNFMDGLDGFSGGMAVFGFGGLGLLAALQGAVPFALLCFVIAAAAGGFVLHNFPPAKIFMGDSGSSTLGGLAGILTLWADRYAGIPLWLSLLLFAPFVVDATVTLLRRMFAGERFWEAHKSHYYQRLVVMGWSHRRTVLSEYALMASCVVLAAVALRAPVSVDLLMLAGAALFFAAAIISIHRAERRKPVRPE